MGTNKYYKGIKAVTIVTAILSLLWIYWTVGRSYNTVFTEAVPLREGFEVAQMCVIASYCIFALALIVVQMIFLVKQMKSIKNGLLFDKSSVKYLVIWGVLWAIYNFMASNVYVMVLHNDFDVIIIDGTTIGVPIIAFTFAILYRLAADVAEENNLTI